MERDLLDQGMCIFSALLINAKPFSKVVSYIPARSVCVPWFYYTHANTYYYQTSIFAKLVAMDLFSPCGFDLHYLNSSELNIDWSFRFLFLWSAFSSLLPIFLWIICLSFSDPYVRTINWKGHKNFFMNF